MSDNNMSYVAISDEDALAIINSGNASETIALAKQQGISPHILGILFRLYPDVIMVNPTFAAIKETDYLENIFRLNRSVIPGMKTLDYGWFDWLLNRDDSEVRQFAASNRTLPSNLYDYCFHSPDRSIRIGLASNQGVPEKYIRMLSDDPDPIVSRIANQNIHDRENSSLKIVVSNDKLTGKKPEGGSTTLLQDADYQEPSPLKIYEDDQDNSGILHVDKKSHPIVFVAIILGGFCLALVLITFSKSPKTVEKTPVSPSPLANASVSPSTILSATDDKVNGNHLAAAFSIAANNSEKAKTATGKSEWLNITARWEEAINLLEKIPSNSSFYSVAQERIGIYENLKANAKKRAS